MSSLKLVNKIRVWSLFDTDGDNVETATRTGWDDDEPSLADELVSDNIDALYAAAGLDDDAEGSVEFVETFNNVDSICMSRRWWDVMLVRDDDDDVLIARVEFESSCDSIEKSEFRENCESFDAMSPVAQFAACEENEADRADFDEDLGASFSCPRCRAGRLCVNHEDISFIHRVEFDCSVCDLDVSEDADASSAQVARCVHGQDDSITIYRDTPLTGGEQYNEPTEDAAEAWWQENHESAAV